MPNTIEQFNRYMLINTRRIDMLSLAPTKRRMTSLIFPRLASCVLLTLACVPSYGAGKSSGQINLPIERRPSIATSIIWSQTIKDGALAALTAKTPTGTAAPKPTAVDTWLGTNFARHHMIPQTSLQALYQLSQTGTDDVSDNADKQSLLKSLKTIQATGYPGVALGGVVWAPVNLFEGPTRFYRADDPADAPEPNRPKSVDNDRWLALQGVVGALNKIGVLNAAGDKFVVNAKVLNAQGGLKELASAMKKLADYVTEHVAKSTVQAFLNTDWSDLRNGKRPLNLQDLVGYYDSKIVTDSILTARKAAYQLK
jgi:hypothetical protein